MIVPEGMKPVDPEDIGDEEEGSQESGVGSQESDDDDDDLFPMQKPQPKVQDFDFGDDFW